jgi:hypothetical protein
MSTSTPPPYFPQNKLSPSDVKARKKFIFGIIGCLLLVLLAIGGAIVGGIIYWSSR